MPDISLAVADPLEFAERLWNGEEAHPFGASGTAQIDPDTLFVASFANVSVLRTSEGLLVVDAGGPLTWVNDLAQLREWSPDPVARIVLTHGHVDHVSGLDGFDSDASERGFERPHVVAHQNVPARFDRYRLTAGYNAEINRRQFQVADLTWPTEYRMPDESYADEMEFALGGETFELHHAKGETDDETWIWAPDRGLVLCGDLFIWSCPNAGNPQKVQRYPAEWAAAMRQMAKLQPVALLPGHGPPLVGAARVRSVLNDTATYLEHLVSATVDLMNEGRALDEILHLVKPLPELEHKPYLRAIYDEPEFIVRNIWRLYGGWFDGDPSSLKPAPKTSVARELADLSGGATAIARRARELLGSDPRLASHLAEIAYQAAPDDPDVNEVRAEVYEKRAESEPSTMSKGIFSWAARTSRG
jgi:glyoxylase-like metal-dependent hydrolase (beta-lactamase superfamily II)